MWQKNGGAITEIARSLSTEKFYSSVAKMQKKRMTTPKLWASFGSQNRQEVQIPANFAVKSWEDQIFGARRRCHRTTDKDHAIPVKQGFRPCFFLPFSLALLPSQNSAADSMRQSRTPHEALRHHAYARSDRRWLTLRHRRPAGPHNRFSDAESDKRQMEDFFAASRRE